MAKKGSKPSPGSKASKAPADADLGILRQLVALLDESSATQIKLQRADASYEVSRGALAMPAAHAPAAHAHHPAPAASAAGAPAAAPATEKASNLLEIKSPMVGTYYRSPEPGAEPYLKAGTRVTPGQTLCIIEAMKIMNELESEVSGVVRDILVEDAQPVEFGQVLFRVDPNG